MNAIIQLVTGAAGSVGFGLIFHINRRYLPAAAMGGALGWLVYLLLSRNGNHIFVSMLAASFCGSLCRNTGASVWRSIHTVFCHFSHTADTGKYSLLLHERTGRRKYHSGRRIWKSDIPVCTWNFRGNGNCLVYL